MLYTDHGSVQRALCCTDYYTCSLFDHRLSSIVFDEHVKFQSVHRVAGRVTYRAIFITCTQLAYHVQRR
jgi:hypothetical protein